MKAGKPTDVYKQRIILNLMSLFIVNEKLPTLSTPLSPKRPPIISTRPGMSERTTRGFLHQHAWLTFQSHPTELILHTALLCLKKEGYVQILLRPC